jgi:hypothetical protein
MGHAPSIDAKISSQISSQRTFPDISPGRQRTRKSLIAHILDALHHARRLQAKRTLHQYRHLLDDAVQGTVGKPNACSGDHRHGVE